MPTLTEKQCDDIIRYLQTEAFKDAVIKGPLIDDIVDLLADNGYSIPASNRGKYLLGTGGNTQRYAILKSDKVNLSQADADSVALGFSDLVERDDYTRNIQVRGKATTGTQKTSKTTPANVTPPSRALNATFFDHNGMMAKNILSIAATGLPEAGWIASAKKIASGINYTTELPISVGASYIVGDRGINQALQGTASSTPANVQTPTPPTPTPIETTEEPDEVVEDEVVEEEVPKSLPISAIPYPDTLMAKEIKGYDSAQKEERRLSISKWEERDKTESGMYPYPLKAQPIYFKLTPAPEDSELQFTNIFADPSYEGGWDENVEDDSNKPAFNTPQGILVVKLDSKIAFTTDISSGQSIKLTDIVKSYTLKWGQPGSADKIELFEAKNAAGDVIFKVIDGRIIELVSEFVIMGDSPNNFLTVNQTTNISAERIQIIIGAESTSFDAIQTDQGHEEIVTWTLANPGAKILFYSIETEPVATVDVYEQDMVDINGIDPLIGEEVLARIAGSVSDIMDSATTYIKVFLDLDGVGAKTTDLFSGRIRDSDSRLTALIFPGDQIDLDIQGVNSELGLEDQLDKVTALKEVKHSSLVPAIDSDGNNLGYSTVSDATLTFEHTDSSGNLKKKVIQIPDINGELAGRDTNGREVKGQVESIEVHSGNAPAQYETQKMIRRSNRMSPNYNLPNPSATDQNATASVAFRIGRKYYILGRRAGKPILVEVDLNYQTEA